ncbi:hypothetical protein D3C87_1473550 [compost metagenome]
MAPVERDDPDPLGAIHRAAAPHRQQDVAPLGAVEGAARHHLMVAGVGADLVIDGVGEAFLLQATDDLTGPARRDHSGIGHHEDLGRGEVAGIAAHQAARPRSNHELWGDELAELLRQGRFHPAHLALLQGRSDRIIACRRGGLKAPPSA